MTIWIVAITHKHGTNYSAHRTEAGAVAALAAFAGDWWAQEMPKDEIMPEGQQDAIDRYFEVMADRGEYYEITGDVELED